MKEFDYKSADTLQAALEFISNPDAIVVAGGTNVMPFIRSGKFKKGILVSIRDINELRYILEDDEYIKIGALTTIADIKKSALIANAAPALSQAANVFADPTICNTATIGGNIKNASPASDTAPALMVHDALVYVRSMNGERIIPIEEFFTAPGKTALNPDELITHVQIKKSQKTGFIKLGMRKSMSISIVTAAAFIETCDDAISSCRIALGAVAPTPIRAKNTENYLLNKQPSEETFENMEDVVASDISPIDDIRASADYRRQVAPVMVKRAIRLALHGHC